MTEFQIVGEVPLPDGWHDLCDDQLDQLLFAADWIGALTWDAVQVAKAPADEVVELIVTADSETHALAGLQTATTLSHLPPLSRLRVRS